jgi:hypothetical protein
MSTSRGFLKLSRFEVAAKSSVVITNHPDADATLWIESGAIHLDDPAHTLQGGPIALGNGPIVVHNPGDRPAVVFAAIAHATAVVDTVDTAQLFSVICQQETGNHTLETDLSAEDAVAFASDHNNNNLGHHASTQRQ